MIFANPSYLWALGGLLVPLAIHLWSKKEAKTVKIGSVQLLDESNSRQSSSIQLNEWLLLLLRMLIVALVVLLMAGPKWRTASKKNQTTYIVEPSLVDKGILNEVLDSLSQDSPVYLLENGFPEWESDMIINEGAETPRYWQLVQSMDSLPSDSIVVFTNAYAKGIHSMRPTTHKKLHWVIMDSEEVSNPLMAWQGGSGMELTTMNGNGQSTWFEKEILDNYSLISDGDSLRLDTSESSSAVPVLRKDTIRVNMFADEAFEMEQRYIKASFGALSKFLKRPIKVNDVSDVDDTSELVDLNIWLRTDTPAQTDGKWLVFKKDPLAKNLIEKTAKKDLYALTSRLNSENTVEHYFSEQLLDLLDLDAQWEGMVTKLDARQMDVAQFKPNYGGEVKRKERATFKDATGWFLSILFVLMIVERIVSYIKRQ